MKTQESSYDLAALFALVLRVVVGWTYFSAFWRRTILENKLDSKRFKFNTNFPTDDNGMPTIIDFTDKNSFDIGFDNGKIINFKGVIIN